MFFQFYFRLRACGWPFRSILSSRHWMRCGLGVAALLALGGCRPSAPAPVGPGMSAPVVTVAPVVQREMVQQDTFSAHLEAAETVEIRPRTSGYLTEVRFTAGQMVQQGDVLFVINPRPAEAALKVAEAALTRAEVAAEIATREAARAARLLADKTLSSEEADQRQWRDADARAALLGAKAAVDTARIQLGYCEVRSPIHGRISRPLVTQGNNVSGVDGFTTLLATVISVDPIHAYAAVDEAALLRFRKLEREGKLPRTADGRIAIELTLANDPTRVFPGVIEHQDIRLDPGTGSILLRSELANPKGELVPGLFARVRVPSSAKESVLLVSEEALGTEQSLKYVYTLSSSNTVQKSFVTLGGSIEGLRIVKSGLKASDRVVVNGLQRILFPGMPVEVQK